MVHGGSILTSAVVLSFFLSISKTSAVVLSFLLSISKTRLLQIETMVCISITVRFVFLSCYRVETMKRSSCCMHGDERIYKHPRTYARADRIRERIY